jgi:succinate dehydrogenase/fumarate reductase flavoprotein subunit
VLGHIAGEGVAAHLRKPRGAVPDIDMDAANDIRAAAMAHQKNTDGIPWKEFERQTRQTVSDYVGVRRNAKGLTLALDTLRALAVQEPTLKADDLHGLMRVQESKSIRLSAELMAHAALARQETRTRSSHRRLDYPDTDDANWRKFVLLKQGAQKPDVSTLSCDEPLAAAFTRSNTKELSDVG